MLVLHAFAAPQCGDAADFCVESELFLEDGTQPMAKNLTVFYDGMIYDFSLDETGEATVFDTRTYQFTLLDGDREVQSRLTRAELLELTAGLHVRARKTSHPVIRFAASPKFQESYEENTQRLTLANDQLSYSVLAEKPKLLVAVHQYRDFADWFARLNTTRNSFPSAARIALNNALSRRQLIPRQITRRIPSKDSALRTEHSFRWDVNNDDRQRIENAKDWSRRFRSVSLVQFRNLQAGKLSP